MRRIALLLLPIVVCAALLPSLGAAQEGAHRAGLVVRFGDGRVVQQCVSFAEESLSGEQLLARAGLPVIVQPSGIGAAVCKIGDEGCDYPAQDCFCKCTGASCAYWALSRLEGGAWRYSNQGASSVQVRNGDVQGWAWGAGSVQQGGAPPVRSFAELCEVAPTAEPETPVPPSPAPPTRRPTSPPPTAAPPTATSAPAETATSTGVPTSEPTSTAAPTQTAPATSTPAPSVAPAPSATPEAVAALPPPTSAPAEQAQPSPPPASGPPGGYVALAALLAALLAGLGVVAWRRRQ